MTIPTPASVNPEPEPTHIPVMAREIRSLTAPIANVPGSVLIDATLGLAGHTIDLLRSFPQLHIIGIDRDPDALVRATARAEKAGVAERLYTAHATYDAIGTIATEHCAHHPEHFIAAAFFDLGVSSMQLDQADRGFAYAIDAPLDMRMDPTSGITAATILATYDEGELARILRQWGEERFARRIAKAIVAQRRAQPLTRSGQLVALLREAIPAASQKTGGHPAKRTFQALRIAVNDEMGVLTRAIPAALGAISAGGRVIVLSYHSLEDRIVKHAIAPHTVSSAPLDLPVELPEHAPTWRWLTRGVQRPTDEEVASNSRAASARLRAAEKILVDANRRGSL